MRALLYRHQAWRAGLLAIAMFGGLALVLPLVGHLVATNRTAAMSALGTAALIAFLVLVGAIVIGAIAPRRSYARDQDLARWVGRRHGPIASDLLSSVELVNAPARPGAPSPALVDALVEATEGQLAKLEPHALLPAHEIPRARAWALGALAANIALVVLVPHFVGAGWRALVSAPPAPYDGAELSAVPLVGDLGVTLTAPPYAKRKVVELPSSSGDLRGLPGTTVAFKAKLLVPASAAELVIEPAAGGASHALPAKVEGDQITASFVIDHSARYRFAITDPSGERSIEATPRAIEAEVDQSPTVQLLAPGDPLDVSNMKSVELAYVIEDDFEVTSAELVWEAGKDRGKKPIQLASPASPGGAAAPNGAAESITGAARAQGKLTWDIAEVQVPSGGEVRYWIEAKDNDAIAGPNVGKSRELHLRVISPRERHEETLNRQQVVAEKVLKNLSARLTGPGDDIAAREELDHQLRDAIVELRSVSAAFDKDPHASDLMR
ncbi:MAG: DUF4175 family protein, partial [Kofleriaceae bacterium]